MSTFIEKMLGKPAGTAATVTPNYIVINDGVSHRAVDEITAVADRDRVWVIYDHDVPTGTPQGSDRLKKNLMFAKKYGCRYIQAKGVGYQYMLNCVVKPGEIIIGAGSHGSIFGAIGALGINVPIPELARIAETGRYSVMVPETVCVSVTGQLKKGTSVMDAAFTFLKNMAGIEGKVIEFYCPNLTAQEKAVLCSMACMTGAYTAVVREGEPANAVKFSLDGVEPMIMMPCGSREEQGNAVINPKSALEGTALQGGQISGYTGGTIEELRKAAELIEGKKLALGFRLTVCPATAKDYIEAMEEGMISKFIDYGAQISAAGDHSVVTQGAGVMGHGEKLLTTGLYTFSGAMGCEDAFIYSGSVESVITASTTKKI